MDKALCSIAFLTSASIAVPRHATGDALHIRLSRHGHGVCRPAASRFRPCPRAPARRWPRRSVRVFSAPMPSIPDSASRSAGWRARRSPPVWHRGRSRRPAPPVRAPAPPPGLEALQQGGIRPPADRRPRGAAALCRRARLRSTARRIVDPLLALQHRAAGLGQAQRAVRGMIDARKAQRHQLAEHVAPGGLVEIGADAEYTRACRDPIGTRSVSRPRSTSIRWTAPKRWPVR